ncbi:hypothetical protein PybrP1_007424 [[Pythium] brassicae (nom. inval.)]|nr:hypothetical protein PybrP1_007424 [[Pythium] brassicae (nom. inval.)]
MSAEAELNAVKKLEANKFCANCDAFSKFGHGNVCEKFHTFVCSNCKSAHQSFSMRVKSVSMSNWSKEEVDALREENGGGNALAKRVWLGKWDETQMRKPTDKDHVDYFKKFITRVYNDRAFYDDAPGAAKALPRKDSAGSQRRASPVPANVNLLDFGAQPAAASADEWGAFASAPAPAPAPTSSPTDGFGDFAAFSSAPPVAAQAFDPFGGSPQVAAATPAQAFDPFGGSPQVAAATPAQAFNPFGVSAQAPVQPVSFDPFGPSGLLQPAAPLASGFSAFAPAPTVMNGGGYQQQHAHLMGGGYGANAGASISAFMNPSGSHEAASSGVGFVRQAPAGGSSSRDPFAGLGLPQH